MAKYIEVEKLIEKVQFARDNFYKKVDTEPKDVGSLCCAMYCDALLEQINKLSVEGVTKNDDGKTFQDEPSEGILLEGTVYTSAFTSYIKIPKLETKLKEVFPKDTEVIVQIRKKY